MDFQKLTDNITSIVDILNNLPEQYRDRCFAALLDAAIADATLNKTVAPGRIAEEVDQAEVAERVNKAGRISEQDVDFSNLPRRLTEWMRKYDVSIQQLKAYVELDGEEVYFAKRPSRSPKSLAQICWALALALESAIKSGVFQVSSDAVRAKVKEEDCYDGANFATIMTQNRDVFYGGVPKKGEDPRRLSEEGEKRLAEQLKAAVA